MFVFTPNLVSLRQGLYSSALRLRLVRLASLRPAHYIGRVQALLTALASSYTYFKRV